MTQIAPQLHVQNIDIPILGLGTWRLSGQACYRAVAAALACGYRHIDTATAYGNEIEVGSALRDSRLARSAVFVTTKVWRDDLNKAALLRSAEQSLARLGLDYVDLLLIHWPNAQTPLAETMAALGDAKRRGLSRSIGVSNFPVALLEQAWQVTREPLVDNQCEYHPRLDQQALLAACRRHNMAFTSYCPLGRGQLFSDPVILGIAASHRKTPAQVILRWHIQQPAVIAIPKSASPARIEENFQIFDFELSDLEISAISALRRANARTVNPAWAPDWDR
jgi:diketogulonate reductase-like aldo/keto reductase